MSGTSTAFRGETEAQSLTLARLHKTYMARGRESFEAVKGIDMAIEPGELVALLGPSGCGKTTTLRLIAGLETVTSGEIRIGDRLVNDLTPSKRNVGVGFESYALYPPLNVRENLAYGLKARGVKDHRQRVDQMAERLEMTDILGLRPASLSSGQKQKVALARALIRKPPVLLLDEPLGHLDAAQRERVRRELKLLQRESGYTTIVVTHDQLEALSLADRIAVMDHGVIKQFGTPDEVFDDPANQFVADFVGEPNMNQVEGTVVREGDKVLVSLGSAGRLEVAASTPEDGRPVVVGLRPQDCRTDARDDEPHIEGRIRVFEHLLEYGLATTEVAGVDGLLVAETRADERWATGETIRLIADPRRVYLFDADGGERIR